MLQLRRVELAYVTLPVYARNLDVIALLQHEKLLTVRHLLKNGITPYMVHQSVLLQLQKQNSTMHEPGAMKHFCGLAAVLFRLVVEEVSDFDEPGNGVR
jgi:hypothetical protein